MAFMFFWQLNMTISVYLTSKLIIKLRQQILFSVCRGVDILCSDFIFVSIFPKISLVVYFKCEEKNLLEVVHA